MLVGDVFGTRRYGVGAGPFEVELIVGREEWLSAPLQYAVEAAISTSAARVSLRVRRLPTAFGLDRVDA